MNIVDDIVNVVKGVSDVCVWLATRQASLEALGSDQASARDPDNHPTGLARHNADETALRASGAAFDRMDEGLLAGTCLNSASAERRTRTRHESLILTPDDRARARSIIASASFCRTASIACSRYVPSAAGLAFEVMAAMMPCHTRACDGCDQARRQRQMGRWTGRWATFATVGVPARSIPCAIAWRLAGTWASTLFGRIRDYLRHGQAHEVRLGAAEKVQRGIEMSIDRSLDRKSAEFRYAWVLEAHTSGWPHLHFVTNAIWIDQEWLKEQWGLIIGAAIQWATVKSVYSDRGVCWYLAKYGAKAHLTLDILSIMYRRRLYASTMPAPLKREPQWVRDTSSDTKATNKALRDPVAAESILGLWVKLASPGRWAVWHRAAEWSELDVRWSGPPTQEELWSGKGVDARSDPHVMIVLRALRDEFDEEWAVGGGHLASFLNERPVAKSVPTDETIYWTANETACRLAGGEYREALSHSTKSSHFPDLEIV